jgi:phosphatidylglycerol lysyltransferase
MPRSCWSHTVFTRKLRPDAWEPIYLAFPRERSSIWAMRDGLRAFAGTSLGLFALRTALRGPTPLVRLLERALVPWTLILSTAPVHPWFPSRAVQAAWVVFDVALIWSLRALRRRWSSNVAACLASAMSVDALLTLVQAPAWNRPRLDRVSDAIVVGAACMAPMVSALVMWGAFRRMRGAQRQELARGT